MAADPYSASDHSLDAFRMTAQAVRERQAMHDFEMKRRAEQIQMAMAGGFPSAGLQNAVGGGAESASYTPMEKLRARLGLSKNGVETPFHHIHVVPNKAKGNVVVFLVVNNEPMYLEDDEALFPSDRLIGQLNILRS